MGEVSACVRNRSRSGMMQPRLAWGPGWKIGPPQYDMCRSFAWTVKQFLTLIFSNDNSGDGV